ncbi:YbaY family lipoprotein [Photobacterium sanguinicancri]|uniref:Lipoprotein-related protein n=1 Tax=Photobacterium sanguinicancri TaxID=875932 RepID=A0AAW7Y9A2_9GAMM|nr:YbaY family lipoprotein [Photobacterium sanguinicancri]MDO6497504.1 YbaY family lipoprotein [Photobacterium sanguinicancri]MDO6544515.1 YbaY family lipoprotein [Photobacterium sanguinicancri]OZS44946.1 lipoprotein-related protein [Photobacterium sanguinicancri]
MKKVITVLLGLAAALAVTACSTIIQQDKGIDTVEGTVSYRERIAIPAEAKVTVTLSDVSLMDVAAEVISQQSFLADGKQVPFSFQLDYETDEIIANHTYAVSARIEVDGKLMFITDTSNRVITDPNKTEKIDLMLVKTH